MAFVEETSVGHGSRTHMTAIEFILQPFPYEKVASFATRDLAFPNSINGANLVLSGDCRSTFLEVRLLPRPRCAAQLSYP